MLISASSNILKRTAAGADVWFIPLPRGDSPRASPSRVAERVKSPLPPKKRKLPGEVEFAERVEPAAHEPVGPARPEAATQVETLELFPLLHLTLCLTPGHLIAGQGLHVARRLEGRFLPPILQLFRIDR